MTCSTYVIGLILALALPARADGLGPAPLAPTDGNSPPSAPLAPLSQVGDHGLTFEVSLGLGLVHSSAGGCGGSTSDLVSLECDRNDTVGIAAVGVGAWVQPKLAVTARFVGERFRGVMESNGLQRDFVEDFLGAAVQYWISAGDGATAPLTGFWLGGGLGLALIEGTPVVDPSYGAYGAHLGPALEGRMGYSFGSTTHTAQISVEAMYASFSGDSSGPPVLFVRSDTLKLALMIGYQFR